MANRHTVKRGMLADLIRYLEKNGWTFEPTKGAYEVLRARMPGKKNPLLIHDRTGVGRCFSIDDRDMRVYEAWKKDRVRRGMNPNWETENEYSEYTEDPAAYMVMCKVMMGL